MPFATASAAPGPASLRQPQPGSPGNDRMTSMQLFTEEGSADLVNARIGPDTDPRLREIMEIFVAHIHAAVKESRLTDAEWARGIEFLKSVGQFCSEWRSEGGRGGKEGVRTGRS